MTYDVRTNDIKIYDVMTYDVITYEVCAYVHIYVYVLLIFAYNLHIAQTLNMQDIYFELKKDDLS